MFGISILVCCYNGEHIIAETLSYIAKQKVLTTNWELILIDNNSNDNTSKVASESWNFDKYPNFRIVTEKTPGLSFARLKGISEAKYNIVSFVDDDNFIPENWVEYLLEKFSNPEIGVLGCTSIGKFDFEVPKWYEKHKLAFATGELYPGKFTDVSKDALIYGAGMTIRKEVFIQLNKHHWKPYLTDRVGNSQSGGGDSEISLAARLVGFKIFYSNEIVTLHKISQNRLSWQRLKAMTEGFGHADVFIIPYQYAYKKKQGTLRPLDNLRKYYWFNILGKTLAYYKSKMLYILGKISFEDFEIIEIRNKSFRKSMYSNRFQFESSFEIIEQL